ncbi:retrovirus-related pol polyprotein from transposon TNT 1-94 [Tanacetum coccineum]
MAPSTRTNPNTPLTVNPDNSINDLLSISNSDHPRMVLTQTPFNDGNFLGWSRNIKMALGDKLKLRFIDGTYVKTICAQELWKEIAERYGQSNGPLIYQLERELSYISQAFFANLHGNKATYNGKKEVKSGGPNRTEFKKYKGKKGTRMVAQATLDEHMVVDTPFDLIFENGIGMGHNGMFDQKLVAAICSEVM